MTAVSGVAIKTLHTNVASIGGLELGSVALTTEDGVAGTCADWHGQQTQSLLLVFLFIWPVGVGSIGWDFGLVGEDGWRWYKLIYLWKNQWLILFDIQ